MGRALQTLARSWLPFQKAASAELPKLFGNGAKGHKLKPPQGGSLLAVQYLASSRVCIALNRFSARVWSSMTPCKNGNSLKWLSAAGADRAGE